MSGPKVQSWCTGLGGGSARPWNPTPLGRVEGGEMPGPWGPIRVQGGGVVWPQGLLPGLGAKRG